MDFVRALVRKTKNGIDIEPDFITDDYTDLMIRGNAFYAVWDEENTTWSTNPKRCVKLIDKFLREKSEEVKEHFNDVVNTKYLRYSSSGSMAKWKDYLKKLSLDSFTPLDSTIVFSNTEKKKELYSSHSLKYALAPGTYDAYDELMSVLYSPEERDKLEWIIGSIVTGDSKNLQKFAVLIGDAGSGKSTVIKIVNKLFEGYCKSFNASILGSKTESFPLESLKDNPLVAYDNETDLSDIKSNTTLNSLIAHEPLVVNTKFEKKFIMSFSTMLILCSNEEVKITNARSGLQRRLIDIRPTGSLLPFKKYNSLMNKIDFELGAIAWHCKEVYESDKEKYLNYRPSKSIRATNYTYNFLEENYFEYKDGVSLKRLWNDYKKYCDEAGIKFTLDKLRLEQEAGAYFKTFLVDSKLEDGTRVYRYFKDIRPEKFGFKSNIVEVKDGSSINDKLDNNGNGTDSDEDWLDLKPQHSLLDDEFKDFPAQYAKLKNGSEVPIKKWDDVKTTLKDLDTSKVHYVLPDDVYIELDLDLKDDRGKKNYDINIKAAREFEKTYVETSKSDQALHLVYKYTGDPSELNSIYDEDIEIKVHLGKASMRRKLTRCNNVPIATITSGLPLRERRKKVYNEFEFKDANHLRNSILKMIKKVQVDKEGFHAPTVSLIYKDLEDAYNQGFSYDVSDLANLIYDFGQESTHQKKQCAELVAKMKFRSKDYEEAETRAIIDWLKDGTTPAEIDEYNRKNKRWVVFDVEVYPNLLVFCYAFVDDPDNVIKLINPTGDVIDEIFKNYYIGGFNNRRYDNHICYARMLGYSNAGLFKMSQGIINNERNVTLSPAYGISDFDIWDIASNKQGLKKWEYYLIDKWNKEHPGMADQNPYDHVEMSIPWDQPAPEDMWEKIAEYCANDVRATIGVLEEIKPDFKCREILSELSGLTVNNTNREHITKILVGDEKNPQHVYTDLATGEQDPDNIPGIYAPGEIITAFPGYEYIDGMNMFRGTDVGKGGYVYAEPGMYKNVALLDVGNMHGASILALNKFGEHTKNYKMIRDARMAIKHHDYETAAKLFDGKLQKYLGSDEEADQLQTALKLVLNSTYGIAAATFDNPLRDKRDVNNIIALRGALFMRTLQDEVASRGFTVAHIKTDSIKIPDATPEIIEFVMEFGKKYGYEFEHEATYAKMCLVNGSTYIAKYDDKGIRNKGGKKANEWTATAAQFQIPYVFKTLFSHEKIEFKDLCETKSVQQGALYLDFNENLGDDEHDYQFVGKVGRFCPMKEGCNAGILYRVKDDKYYAATGSKGYKWMESKHVQNLHLEDWIDKSYYDEQVNEAIKDISQYGDFNWFVADDPDPEDYEYFSVDKDPLEDFMNKPEVA